MKDVAYTDAITLLRLLNDSKVAMVAAELNDVPSAVFRKWAMATPNKARFQLSNVA
jgi:hypothetical protein